MAELRWFPSAHKGSYLWSYLHTLSLNDCDDPELQRIIVGNTLRILRGIPSILSCSVCIKHYNEHVIPAIQNEDDWLEPLSLFRFIVDYHNKVNEKIGKPIMTHEEALARWGTQIPGPITMEQLKKYAMITIKDNTTTTSEPIVKSVVSAESLIEHK